MTLELILIRTAEIRAPRHGGCCCRGEHVLMSAAISIRLDVNLR